MKLVLVVSVHLTLSTLISKSIIKHYSSHRFLVISPKQALFYFLSASPIDTSITIPVPRAWIQQSCSLEPARFPFDIHTCQRRPCLATSTRPAVAGLAACETVRLLSSLSAGNAAPDHAPSHSRADGDDSAVRSNRRGEGRQAGCRGRRRPLPIQPRSGHDAPPASSSAAWRHVSARACPPSTTSHGDRTGSWCDRWPPRMVAAACG